MVGNLFFSVDEDLDFHHDDRFVLPRMGWDARHLDGLHQAGLAPFGPSRVHHRLAAGMHWLGCPGPLALLRRFAIAIDTT